MRAAVCHCALLRAAAHQCAPRVVLTLLKEANDSEASCPSCVVPTTSCESYKPENGTQPRQQLHHFAKSSSNTVRQDMVQNIPVLVGLITELIHSSKGADVVYLFCAAEGAALGLQEFKLPGLLVEEVTT